MLLCFMMISIKGGENIKKLGKRLLFILIVSLLVFTSLSAISAEDNSTLLASGAVSDDILQASNTINVHVDDSYIPEDNTWSEDGINLANASIFIYDGSGGLVFSGITDSEVNVLVSNLKSEKYTLVISYATYEPYVQTVDLTTKTSEAIDYMFVPDILLLVDYNSQNLLYL